MTFCIQYDDQGTITATVLTDGAPPACEQQILLDDIVSTSGMCVDVLTKTLQPVPT